MTYRKRMNKKTKYYGIMYTSPYEEITIRNFNRIPKQFILSEWEECKKADAYKTMVKGKVIWVYDLGDVLYGFGNNKSDVIEAIKRRYLDTMEFVINDETRRKKNGKKDKQN